MSEYHAKGEAFAKEFETLWNIFLNVICDSESKNVICVLDALDECSLSIRGQLLNLLTKLFSNPASFGSPRVKFFVTSRPYPSIERLLKNFHRVRLKEKQIYPVLHRILHSLCEKESAGPRQQKG